MDMVEKQWYCLCWSAKWLGKNKMMSSALPDHSIYNKDKENDYFVMKALWKLVDEADVVVAHNAIKFDVRKINTRFIANGMTPPSPYRVVDTLIEARKYFSFMSNRLNDLGQTLNLGKKVPTGGFKLWKGCLEGDSRSWKHMVKYCKQDVVLLEKVYSRILPYIKHPNRGVFVDLKNPTCPNCGSTNIIFKGYSCTNASKFRRTYCKSCGSWSRAKVNELTKNERKNILTN